MREWYYVKEGKRHGPIYENRLHELINGGDITRDDLVWTAGMEKWRQAFFVEGLFSTPPDPPSNNPNSKNTTGSTVIATTTGENNRNLTATAGSTFHTSTASITFASFWKRTVALVIDLLILTVTTVLISSSLFDIFGGEQFEVGSNLVGFVIAWLYYAGWESSNHRATLGKKAVNIQVIDTNGEQIGFGKATGRHFAKIISGLILGTGYLMAGFTEKKQALHDIMASCFVVEK